MDTIFPTIRCYRLGYLSLSLVITFMFFNIGITVGQVQYLEMYSGGKFGAGTIFKFYPAIDSFAKIFDFDSIDGKYPYNRLVQGSDYKLYGTTLRGGANGFGVIFMIDPSTDSVIKVHDFNGTDAAVPVGWMTQLDNGIFYGIGGSGGVSEKGNIFAFDPTLGTVTDLHDFGNGNDGNTLQAGLTLLNNKLYGTTGLGPAVSPGGEIYSYEPDSGLYKIAAGFNGDGVIWANSGGVTVANGNLFGMTTWGGSNSSGTLYDFNITDSTLSTVFNFDSSADPIGGLLLANDGKMYGMTVGDTLQTTSRSELFQYDPTLNTVIVKYIFGSNLNDGSMCGGTVIQSANGLLYGTTIGGGVNNDGTIFSYNYITNTYTKLFDFTDSTGTGPCDLWEYRAKATGISEITLSDNLTIYPNPTTGLLKITRLANTGNYNIEISNVLGQPVYKANPNNNQIDVSNLVPGMYLVKLEVNGVSQTTKFVKE